MTSDRATMIRLSNKGLELVRKIEQSEEKHSAIVSRSDPSIDLEGTRKSLRQLEWIWTDYIHYGTNN